MIAIYNAEMILNNDPSYETMIDIEKSKIEKQKPLCIAAFVLIVQF